MIQFDLGADTVTPILNGDERGLTLAPTDGCVLILSYGRAPGESFSEDMLLVWKDMERDIRASEVLRAFVGDAEEVLDDVTSTERPGRDFGSIDGEQALDVIHTMAQQRIMARIPDLGLTLIKVWCALPPLFKNAPEDSETDMLIDVEDFVGQYLDALTYAPELADSGDPEPLTTTGE